MKRTPLTTVSAILLFCIFCFSSLKSSAQLTTGDFAIVGLNGNSATVNMAIVALKVIPSGTVLKITDQGWDQSALVANGSDGLITWTTNSSIPAGTIFNIAITGGASPTATGLEAYGTTTVTGWTTGTVVAGGGDNWFLYTGSDAAPSFIYGFANWSTALPGTNAPDPTTGWQAAGTVSAAVSYLPTTLAAGNFYVTLTIAGTPPTGYHGDYNNYSGTFTGTKASILTAINTKSNWTTTELLANKKSLDPGGAAFPGTNPIFQLGTNVSGVTSSTANGTYKTGDVIAVNVTFSTIVNVTGTPTLSLNTGATVNYSGGTGTNTLTFNYTVASGQSTADLDYSSTTALALNGGTIKDAGNTDATLTLAAPGATNSLGNNKAIVIDGISPTVASVNSSTANGAYKAGDVININLNFSEAITVTGTPQLALNSGATVNYTSGSGTSTLNFNYTVQAGDASADLDYTSTSALSLNGGTLKDAAGNNATLTLATPRAANSLGANKNIVIDNTAPVVSSVNSSLANGTYKIGDLIPVTVNFSEAVTVTGTPTLSLNSGGTASYASGSGTAALLFNYTVALSQSTADLDQASTTALSLAGGTIKDAAGNDATLTLAAPGAAGSLGANKDIVINTTTPTILSITRTGNATINGTSAQFLATFSENVTGVNTSDFIITSTGITAPAITFVSGSNATRTVTVNTGTGSGTLRLDLNTSGTGIINTIGNEIQGGYTAGEVYTIDKTIPTLTTVTIASSNANTARAKAGDVVTLSFTASETIGTPVVSIFGNAATVANTSGNDWTATYTTQTTDANGVIPFNIAFTDVTGNVGTAVTATTNASSVTFDKTAPTLTTVAILSNNASNQTAKTGNIISLSFTASEAVALPVVTIAGNTALTASAGGNSYLATYTLTGTETEGTLAFNIAFTDLAGNAGTAVTATTNSSSVTYDKTIPTLSTVTIASNNITTSKAKLGNVITLNFTASEAIATPTVTMGGTAVTPTNSGNNWTATQTVSGLTPEGVLAFNIAFSDLTGNAGTPVTATTNSSSVTVDRTAPAAPTNLAAISGNTENVISWDASPAPDLDKYILYAGTSNNPTTVLQTIPAGTLTYTHTGLTNGTGYFYRISAVDLTGNEGAKSGNIGSIPKSSQTITFNPLAASVYGATPITLTATSSSALTVTYTSSNTAVATVSGSTVTVLTAGTTTITASQAGNSAFLAATPVTQDLVVNKKDIAVTAAAKTKVYGAADPAFTYTFSPALVGLDTFTGALDRATGENIGDYAIGQGTLALNSNYTVTYVPANLSITTKTITVTAAAKTKVYGDTDPALTYTFAPALTGTDAFTGALNRATGENIGDYAIGQGTLALSGNYTVAYVPANLSITTKTITVTAAAKTKVYGEADPALTYTFTPALTGTDTFTGALNRATGENIGDYAIGQGTLALSGNYTVAYVPANLSITTKTITVTAAAKTKVYGDADPALTYTFAPALTGTDVFTGALNRATGENIGDYAIGQGTLALSGNYTVTYVPANLSITTKTITVTATAKTKVYGEADPALTYTFTPALTGTDVFTGALNRATGENIGDYAISQGMLALSGNYTVAYVPANLSITTKTITVTAAAKTKVYGDADPALTYTFAPALTGTDTFTGALNRATGENIGDYAIGQGTLALSGNYTVTYVPANLSITTKTITVTAAAKTKVYGDADPALTYTFAPALTGTDTFTGALNRATGENIGDYAIGQGTLALSGNYTVAYVPANLSITTKTITVTAAAKTKVYGDADPALTYTFTPALTGTDVFTGALNRATGENIGDYAIGQGTLALSGNYTVAYVPANLSITTKTITVTATAKTKIYGDTDPALTYTFAPALTGTDTFSGALNRATGENIGDYAIGQGTLALSGNYTVTYVPANLTIGTKTITVTAAAKTKIYGDTDPALTYTFAPALTGTDTFTGALNRATGENIGDYAIGQGTLALSGNYTVAYVPANLSITTKTITVTAAAKTKIYGDTDPALTYTFAPALTGTDTFTGALNRATGENIGDYAIGQGTLALSGNYTVAYVPANLSIATKTITVTAAAKTKIYGDTDPALTYTFAPALTGTDTFTGALNRATGENIGDYAIGQGTLALSGNYTVTYVPANLSITTKTITVTAAAKTKIYGDTDPALTYTFAPALTGTDTFTGALNRATGENIGDYAIGQGTLALSGNYTVAYVPANFSITKKTVNVAAVAKTKVYGAADPALTYSFSPALIGTDTFTGNLDRAAGENIGNYAIGQGTLALNSNYILAFTSADLNITTKPVTVTAVAKTKIYGDADPALTYTFSPALTGTDTFTGNLTRTAGENIGDYGISQGSLILSSNYIITYVPANLSITTKALTVTAVAKSKTYGDADPALTYTFSPALTGTDTFTGSLTRAAGENIGSYAISQGTVTAGPNYLITYTPANLSIGTKTISVTATAAAKTYGAADPALTYTFSPALIGTDAFTGSLNRAPGENTGTYAINQNTLSLSSNYVLNYTAANLSINKAVLTITADNKEKFAGTVNPALTVSYSGFVNSETNAVLTTQPVINTTATTGSPLGTYSIVPSGAAAVNYQISYVNGILTIKPGAPTNVLLAGVTLYENKASGTAAGTLSSTSDDPAATFTYSLVAGTGDTDNPLFSISGNQVLTAASLDYENKAVYSIRVRSTTQYGFSLDKTFSINLSDVNEIPTLAAIANQTICYTTATQNISLTGISAGPETTQSTSISVAGNNSALLQSLTVSGSGATGIINYSVKTGASGTATITVTVKDNGGTANGGADTYSRTFVLTVNALPVVSVTADKGKSTGTNRIEVSKGETVFLNATGGATYAWASHSSIVRGLNSATLEVRPRETTTYTVTVTNASGCTESQTFSINVLDDLEKIRATNLVSPNGDGINDKWVVYNIDFYPNNQVKIFDKSGRLIYSKKGYDDSWDATLNGLPLAEGTYYYIIDFGTDRRIFKGYITVVRPEQTR